LFWAPAPPFLLFPVSCFSPFSQPFSVVRPRSSPFSGKGLRIFFTVFVPTLRSFCSAPSEPFLWRPFPGQWPLFSFGFFSPSWVQWLNGPRCFSSVFCCGISVGPPVVVSFPLLLIALLSFLDFFSSRFALPLLTGLILSQAPCFFFRPIGD